MREMQRFHLLCLSAVFAAAITVTTAYLLHIPIPTGGYIHVGDAVLYLAACLLPAPYAVAAAAIGAGLADLLTAPMWVLPTLVIKALVALLFTSRGPRLLCPRNVAAAVGAAVLSSTAYGRGAALPRGLRPGGLPAAGLGPRLLAPVPGHPDPGHWQRRGLFPAGPGAGARRHQGPPSGPVAPGPRGDLIRGDTKTGPLPFANHL